jgi:hypothetical protein
MHLQPSCSVRAKNGFETSSNTSHKQKNQPANDNLLFSQLFESTISPNLMGELFFVLTTLMIVTPNCERLGRFCT